MIVTALVLADFAQMLSLFIPLKVLILLGGEGIPRYLRPFMEPESRDAWIIGLSASTIVLAGLAVILTIIARRTIAYGAGILAMRHNEGVPAKGRLRGRVARGYREVCRGYADLAITGVGLLAIIVLNTLVASVIIAVIITEIVLTDMLLRSSVGGLVAWMKIRVRRNHKLFVKQMATLNFIILFFLLVADYLVLGGSNIVLAILTLLLGRRCFPALTRYVKAATTLTHRQHRVERLLVGR